MNPFINPVFNPVFSRYPLRLVDVGAAGVLRSPWPRASTFLHVYAFEPGARVEDILQGQNQNITVFPVALSDHSGRAMLHETKKPDGSSLLQPSNNLEPYGGSDRFEVVKEYPVEVETLDQIIAQHAIPYVDFLKIDTQGTELQVLKGSEGTLVSVFGIHLEVNFFGRYEGQTYFSDVDSWLRHRGFVLYDLERRYLKLKTGLNFGGPKGALMKGDALYLRNPLIPDLYNDADPESRKARALRKIAIALLYGYVDVAFGLFQEFNLFFCDEEIVVLRDFFSHTKSSARFIPQFRGRVRLARFFKQIGAWLEPRSNIGSSGDDIFGNSLR